MFESLTAAPPDAILGLTEAFKKDPNPDKINLGVGVYKDATGVTPILDCVKQAEKRLLEQETSKSYLAIDGHPDYDRHVPLLVLGRDHVALAEERVVALQTPGGTGGLRVAADFVKQTLPGAQVWYSKPTWANHPNIFAAAGLEAREYAYFDAASNLLAFDKMLADLNQVPPGDVVVLHGCCHNPTGVDPSPDQWQAIAETITRRGALPLLDFAYQGFADGLEEDAVGLRIMADSVDEMLICSSFSKNFGLYSERVGALLAMGATTDATRVVLSQLKRVVRSNYSNPPAHGASVVAAVLGDQQLTEQWKQELATMRKRINGMRQLFVQRIQDQGIDRDFSFIEQQRGMFSFTGLAPEQVDQLREKFSIYMVRSGRINVAGISEQNVDRLCSAIASVM